MTQPSIDPPAPPRAARPTPRERDSDHAPGHVDLSEAELLAARCGDGVRRIHAAVERILPRLEAVGPLTAVTRNALFVHEKSGVYRGVHVNPHVSSVLGPEIDLRIFPARWAHGFAVDGEGQGSSPASLRFFDAEGVAVHEVFQRDGSDPVAWDALVEDLLCSDQSDGLEVVRQEPPPESRPDQEVDVAALESGWRTMKDTHDFFGLLREHRVARAQAFRLVSRELARPAERESVRRILESASGDGTELMVFVRSSGTIQIHHGPVDRVVDAPPSLDVLDPGFGLHVREEEIAETWVVRKPVETGWVTSVEVFDTAGTACAYFFGCREEGQPEDPGWRRLAEGLR